VSTPQIAGASGSFRVVQASDAKGESDLAKASRHLFWLINKASRPRPSAGKKSQMNDLRCSPAVETRLWKIRNLLYRAVQDSMLKEQGEGLLAVKQAYDDIAALLDELQ